MPNTDAENGGRRWTIYVCPGCGRIFTGKREFCAGWSAAESHPLMHGQPVEVVPAGSVDGTITEEAQIVRDLAGRRCEYIEDTTLARDLRDCEQRGYGPEDECLTCRARAASAALGQEGGGG